MSTKEKLEQRLLRYGVTAKGQIAQGRSLGEIAAYAAAVGAGLVVSGTADAGIIYSGVQNISVTIDHSAKPGKYAGGTFKNYMATSSAKSVDLNGDGANDISLKASFSAARTYYGLHTNYRGNGRVNALNGAFLGSGTALNLVSGVNIGPGGNFNALDGGRTRYQTKYGSGAFGNFKSGTTGFLGIKFNNDYGWIRLRLDDLGANQPFGGTLGDGYPDKVTVLDWAYNDSGAAINAGQTRSASSVPEPSSLALLAAGAAGLAAFRRRRRTARRG